MNFEHIQQELNQASSSISLLHKQLDALFCAIPDPIFIINESGNYIEVLAGKEHSLYNDGNHLVGKNVSDIFSQNLCDLFMSVISEVIETGELKIIEYEITSDNVLDSSVVENNWFQGRVNRIQDPENQSKAVVWISINITEKKAFEHKLKELSTKDPLTGLFNRRYFDERIKDSFSRFQRYSDTFTLAFIDIDYFKKVNDTYGHDNGDKVIQELALLVNSELRANDVFARFGGEEFILLLPNSDIFMAENLAERLRSKIEAACVVTDNANIEFTVSIGVTEVSQSDTGQQETLKRADNALYNAKESGRNRVITLNA